MLVEETFAACSIQLTGKSQKGLKTLRGLTQWEKTGTRNFDREDCGFCSGINCKRSMVYVKMCTCPRNLPRDNRTMRKSLAVSTEKKKLPRRRRKKGRSPWASRKGNSFVKEKTLVKIVIIHPCLFVSCRKGRSLAMRNVRCK